MAIQETSILENRRLGIKLRCDSDVCCCKIQDVYARIVVSFSKLDGPAKCGLLT